MSKCRMCQGVDGHVPLTFPGHEGQTCPNKIIETGQYARVVPQPAPVSHPCGRCYGSGRTAILGRKCKFCDYGWVKP